MARGLAFFDMDGTLVDGDCGLRFAAFCARRGLVPPSELWAGARWLAGVALRGPREEALLEAKRLLLRGRIRLGEERADALWEECFEREIRPRLRPEVRREVEAAQREGPVVIVTANLRALALRVARELGVPPERCFGAEPLRDGAGRLTGEVLRPLPMGEERARLVRALAAQEGVPLARVRAYGDSPADAPMLRAVGLPCAVHPGRRMSAIARGERWRVLPEEAS